MRREFGFTGFGLGNPRPAARAAAPPPSGATFGSEQLSNGGFDDGSNWTLLGATISGGKLNGASGSDSATQTVAAPAANDVYRVLIVIDSISTGTVNVGLAGGLSISLTTAGTHIVYIAAPSTAADFGITLGTSDAVIDSVSLKKLTSIGAAAELVTDGGFDNAGAHTLTAGSLAVQNSRLEATAAAGTRAAWQAPAEAIVLNEWFLIAFTISSRTAGSGNIMVGGDTAGGTATGAVSANGDYVRVLKLTTLGSQKIAARALNGAALHFDSYSIKRIEE